ncbi:MAG: hypothetical protein CMM46_00670 [Rhodospirillaceae bacterium]|nr:hypothetical protein [Rhodospirillaceae bacterium]
MSGLAKFLEDEGLATTLIALVRRQSEDVAPPRALWVPFPLGRPFGVPNDAAFQTLILKTALALLDRPSGPILEDFPDDAPADPVVDDGEGWVCPVNFPKPKAASEGEQLDSVLAEIQELAPWYEVSLGLRGRTTVGASGLKTEDAARFLAAFAADMMTQSPLKGVATADALRLAAEDIKAYYFEAATAQPGSGSSDAVLGWFWFETQAAMLIRTLRDVCVTSDVPAIFDVGDIMLLDTLGDTPAPGMSAS